MVDIKLMQDQPIQKNKIMYDKLIDKLLPSISLPNQQGNFLRLNRKDTFRLVIYFYPMTGNPYKKLPKNWNKIVKTQGCTLLNSYFRDNYENLIQLNALPIGISTQTTEEIREMSQRLGIKYDVLSDNNLSFNSLSLPTFSLNNKTYFEKITLIVEKNIIREVFYPVVSPKQHVENILKWLKLN